MKIGDFFVKLGIKADTKVLTKVGNKAKKAGQSIWKFKNRIIAAATAVAYFSKKTYDAVAALRDFGDQTGLDIIQLQKLQKAAESITPGLDGKQVATDIQSLQKKLTDLKFGGSGVQGLRLLGIDQTGKDAFQIINEMKGAIKGLSDADATNLIERTGLSPQFLRVLKLSNAEFDKLSKGRFLSAKDNKKIIHMGEAFHKLTMTIGELKNGFIAIISGPIGHFLDMVNALVSLGLRLYDTFMKLPYSVQILTATFSILLAMISPLTAAFTLFYLIIEDIFVYMQGSGKSLTGAFMKELPKIIGKMTEGFQQLWQYIKDIKDAFLQWADLKIDSMFDWLDSVVEKFGKLLKLITGISASDAWKWITGKLDSSMDYINESASKSWNKEMGEVERNRASNNTLNQHFNVNSTAPAPEVAHHVGHHTKHGMGKTFNQVRTTP